MNARVLKSYPLLTLSLVAIGTFAPQATASGFQLREQSPSAQGNAFAGITAGGEDISSMFFNPASMALFSGNEAILGASNVDPKAEFQSGVASPFTMSFGAYPTSPTSHPNSAESAILPSVYAMWSLYPDLKVGIAINAPFGMKTEYKADYIGRYHALKSDLKTMDIAPTLAYRINPQWSMGVAFVARKADAELTNAVDFGTIVLAGAGGSAPTYMALGVGPGKQDGIAILKGNKWGYGFKLGAIFQPTEQLRIGLAHQSTMKMTLNVDATFQYPTTFPTTIATGVMASLKSKGFVDNTGTTVVNLPSTTSLGINYAINNTFSLQGEAAQTGWSTFKELRVKFSSGLPDSVTEENWKNTMFYALGFSWRLLDAWTLRAGVATDQGAAEDSYRTPRIPDGDRVWYSAGIRYAFNKDFCVDFAYTSISVKDGPIDLKAIPSGTTPTTSPNTFKGNLSGTFKSNIDILAIQARFVF